MSAPTKRTLVGLEADMYGVHRIEQFPLPRSLFAGAGGTSAVVVGSLGNSGAADDYVVLDAYIFVDVTWAGPGLATAKFDIGINGGDTKAYLDGPSIIGAIPAWVGNANAQKGTLLKLVNTAIIPNAQKQVLATLTVTGCVVDDLTGGNALLYVVRYKQPALGGLITA